MGDPKKLKKKYATPAHPWNKAAIEAERELKAEYGLKNKKEILIANSFLKKYKGIAKRLIAAYTPQGEKEKKQMMDKLQKLGLLQTGAELDDVLSLELKDVLERRIQSVVFRKGLSRSTNQARQFITHRHITIDNKEINSPGYILSLEEESKLKFKDNSNLGSEDHPERINITQEVKEEVKETKEEGKEEVKEGKAVKKSNEEKTAKKEPVTKAQEEEA